MTHHRRFTLLFCLLTSVTLGCMDADGNRITFQEWCDAQSREPRDEPEDAPARESTAATRANNVDDTPAASNEAAVHTEPAPQVAPATPNRPRQTPGAAASANRPPSAHAIHSDVLLVNDDKLSVSDVLEPINANIEHLAKTLPPASYYEEISEMVRQQIIESVAQLLIWRRAQGMITEEMEPNLEKAIDKMEKERINREFQGRETIYEKYLAKHSKTREQVRERLKRSIVIDSYLRDHLLPLVPTPRKQDLRDYYESNKAQFSPSPRREMLLIDVPVAAFVDVADRGNPQAIQDARDAAKANAEEALAALKNGEAFEEVARRLSKGVNARDGGKWGFIEHPLKGRWEKPSMALFDLQEGEISDVIEAADSYFIVKVGKVEGAKGQTFTEAQQEIARILRQRKFAKLRAEFLQTELERSTISSLDEFVAEVLRAVPQPE